GATGETLWRSCGGGRPSGSFLGLYTTPDRHVHILAYNSRKVAAPAFSGPAYCAGSAAAKDGFTDVLERAEPVGPEPADARSVVATANALLATFAARDIDALADEYGAVYEMAIADDGNVGKLADTTRIYWEAVVAGSDIRVLPASRFVHGNYQGKDFVVRSARCQPGGVKSLVP